MIFFAILNLQASTHNEAGIYIRYCTTGKLFNIRRFSASFMTHVLDTSVL